MDLLQQIQRFGASRAGQSINVGTQSSGITTISGTALVNAGLGYLFCRAYSENGRMNLVNYQNMPDAFSGRPIAATLLASLNLSDAYFAGIDSVYSLRIVGSVQPPRSGNFLIRLTTSDGARLYLNEAKVIDLWKTGTSVATSQVVMYSGVWYSIVIEHSTVANVEKLLLEWSLDGVSFTTFTHATDSSNFKFAYDASESTGSHTPSLRIGGQTYMGDALMIASPDRALSPGSTTYSGTISNLQADLAGTLTLSFWLEFTASTSAQTILSFGGNRSIQINASNRVVILPTNGPMISTTSLTPSTPVHLMVVITPTVYTLYVNGVVDGGYNGTATTGTLPALSSSVLSINPSPVLANAAILDEIAIWLTAVDAVSALRIFNSGRKISLKDVTNTPTLYSSLYLWYTFNDDGLTLFSDRSSRGNHLNHGVNVVTSASPIPNVESLSIIPGTILHTHNQVGFGTPNPAAQVHVAGRTSNSTFYNGGLMCINSVDSGNSGIVVRAGLAPTRPGGNAWISFEQAGLGGWSIGQDTADARKLKIVGNSSFTPSSPTITVDTLNHVGINQSNPLYALDVSGTINLTGALFQNGNAFMNSQWTTSNSNIYYNAGNVGVGLSNPAFTLDISGSGRISGPLISGSITTRSLGVGLSTPGQLFDLRGVSTWGQQRIIPATDGSETSIGFYRYSNVGQIVAGDTWVVGHNVAQAGSGNFGIGCFAPTGTLSMLTLTTGTYVGIANNAPQFTLDVGGNINFSGALYKGGLAYVSSQWTSIGSNLAFSGGNVGIKNNNPVYTLDVGGNVNFVGTLSQAGTAYISSQWRAMGTNLYFTGGLVGIANSNPQFPLDVGGNINFSGALYKGGVPYVSSQWTSTGTNVYFSGGNVGIKQSNPAYTLDVGGNVNLTGSLTQNGAYIVSSQWSSSGTNVYFSGGNVGVKQSNPAYTLDVGGNVNLTGSLTQNGTYVLSSQWSSAGTNVYFSGGNVGINQATPKATLDVSGSVIATTLTITGSSSVTGGMSVGGVLNNNISGSLLMRVFNDSGLYALGTISVGSTLRSPFTSRPSLDLQIGTLSVTNAFSGTFSAISARINGYIQPPSTGTYLIRATFQDALSLYIGQQKLTDSWLYSGSASQTISTLTMYQNVWYNFGVEHAAVSSSAQSLLIEWSPIGGTYAALTNGSFAMAYDNKETHASQFGTFYSYGHASFQDVVYLKSGIVLPNSNQFTGNASELVNDAGYFKSNSGTVTATTLAVTGTLTAPNLVFSGNASGTLIQLVNNIATVSGATTTTAFAAFGVTPGTALENFALTSHRWWSGSSGTTSGSICMQLNPTGLTIPSTLTSLALQINGSTTATSLTASVVVSGGLLISNTLTASSLSGNAFHVMGGALIARDLYVGGLLNNRAITPSSASYYHASAVSLSSAISPFGYTYPSSAPWTVFKTAGSDAASIMQSSGLFVAQSKVLVSLTWTGYANATTSVFILPTVSTYVMTVSQLNGVTFVPSGVQLSSASVFSISYTLPMAIGDTFALATRDSISVQNVFLSIIAQPLGAP